MSNKGYVDSLLNTLDSDTKKTLIPAFEHVIDTAALGDDTKATNFLWYRLTGTTASVANTEFSIEHGLDHAPSKLIPIMDLTGVGSQLVPLVVSRASDQRRVYLKSSSTGAAISFYVE